MSGFIATRMPALDAALTRFDGWWALRSQRERVLLIVMASLIAVVVTIFLIIRPLQSARAQALADIKTYETISARLRAAGTLTTQAAGGPARTGTPEAVITASAAALSVPVAVQPTGGVFRATVADAPYDRVVSWIADLAANTPYRARQVSMAPGRGGGRVTAVVDFGT